MLAQAIRQAPSEATLAGIKQWALLGAVALQGLPFVEHIARVIQRFFLDLPEAHGILGSALDTEWVHFAYNLALFLVLWGLVLAYRLHHRRSWIERLRWYHLMLVSVATLQLYHMVEHIVKVAQHVTTDCASCPRLLCAMLDLVGLHLFINLLVLVPMTIAVAGFVLAGTSAARTGQQDSIPSVGGK